MRCLDDLALLAPADAETAFAERLSLWIHFTDAIPLSAIHSGELPPAQPGKASLLGQRLSADLNQTRAVVVNSIIKACSTAPGQSLSGLPALPLQPPASAAAAYIPYRRFYEAQQRDIDTRVQSLRTRLRAALATASARLKKLAELDAMFDKILRVRELELLGRVPLLLKARFEHLLNEHQSNPQYEHSAAWTPTDAWLTRFCKDLQTLLLAEADLRLQPALGLLEALKKENTQ